MTLPNGLPRTSRFITDHDSNGKAIFSDQVQEELEWNNISKEASFALSYTTSKNPVSFKDNKDIDEYTKYLAKSPGLSIPGGSVVRVVDMAPGAVSPMHRTVYDA